MHNQGEKKTQKDMQRRYILDYHILQSILQPVLLERFPVRLDAEDIVVVDTIIDKTNNGWKKIGIAEQIVQSMINQNIQRGPILCSDEYINNPDEKCRLNMKQAPFV